MADARLAQAFTNQDSVRVGVLDFEVAPFQTVSEANQVADPSTTFYRIGTLDPGSISAEFMRDLYQIKRGLPRATIKNYVTNQSGKLSMSLDEITSKTIEFVAGGAALVRTSTGSTTVSASPAPTTTVFTVATIGSIAAGKWISVTYAGGTYAGQTFDRKVLSVATSAITLKDPLPAAPSSGDAVALMTRWSNAIGGTEITEYCGRLLFTDEYGDKMVLYLPKFIVTGGYKPDFGKGEEHAKLPIEIEAYATLMTVGSVTDYRLALQHLIPA